MAQVLLTRTDLVQRSRYVNSYRTFRQLLQLGVIPVVNENDTVAVEELKFGDNDTLSAQVASLVGADWLFLLTDVQQLYSADPRYNADAEPIYIVDKVEQLRSDLTGGRSRQSVGHWWHGYQNRSRPHRHHRWSPDGDHRRQTP
jgi:glutamate 5-kinase